MMYVKRNMQMSSDLASNQISLLNSHPNPAHWKYERFACTIEIFKYIQLAKILFQNKKPNLTYLFLWIQLDLHRMCCNL